MTDYEKGSPSWDIGQILTRHGDGILRNPNGEVHTCARVLEIRRTARENLGHPGLFSSASRLQLALAVKCDCGMGESDVEISSLRPAVKGSGND